MSQLTDNEMRPYTFQLQRSRVPNEGTGQFTVAAAGEHPRCKLVSAQAIATIYSTAQDVLAIEHEDGGDVATASAGATIGTPVAFTIAPAAGYTAIFERNEPIIFKASTQGNAANATTIIANFVTVPYNKND